MTVVAKAYVSNESRNAYDKGAKVIRFQAVTRGEENREWAQATPAFNLEMNIKNSPAAEYFELGEEYLVTFERVPKSAD